MVRETSPWPRRCNPLNLADEGSPMVCLVSERVYEARAGQMQRACGQPLWSAARW